MGSSCPFPRARWDLALRGDGRPPPRLAPSPRRYQEPAAPPQPPRYARRFSRRANPCSFASSFRRASPAFQCHVDVSRSRATRLAIIRSSVMVEILSPKIPPVEQRPSQGRERSTRESGRSVRNASLRPRCPCALAYRGARPRDAAFRQGVHLQSRISGASISGLHTVEDGLESRLVDGA